MDKFKEIYTLVKKYYLEYKHKKTAAIVSGIFLVMIIITTFSQCANNRVKVFHKKSNYSFEGGRVLNNNGKSIYQRKEKLFAKKIKVFDSKFKNIDKKMESISDSIEEIKNSLNKEQPSGQDNDEEAAAKKNKSDNLSKDITFGPAPSGIEPSSLKSPSSKKSVSVIGPGSRLRKYTKHKKGPEIISFPVQDKRELKEMSVKIPAGSFVKAKLLTGVEVGGKPLPVLLQIDYAFSGPNKSHVDLTGCFLIAKSTGNLSIERVEMQTTKISCVSKSGRMFERKINGFVTDNKDNSFAITGKINSKQGRVAAMSFLSSVVQGVGDAIKQAQTVTQTHANGNTSSIVSGSQGKFMAAGGAANAASQVSQWYLKHAENLVPTINIGSGRDVWVVVQDTVSLPNWYFRKQKSKNKNGNFKYLSRFLEN